MKLINFMAGVLLSLPVSANALDMCQMMADNASEIIKAAATETKNGRLDIPLTPDADGVYLTMAKVYINTFVKQNANSVNDNNYIEMAEEYIYQQCKQTGL